MARHADSLLYNVDTNVVEQFNSLIAKYIGGKRINYCKKGSYKARCFAAVVAKNEKTPIYKIKKRLGLGNPSKWSTIFEESRLKRNSRKKAKKTKKRLQFLEDKDYGLQCSKPDLPENELEIEMETFLRGLKKSQEVMFTFCLY